MLGWVSTVLIGAVAVALVWYFGARLGRLVRTSTGPQIIGILIAVDIVGALVLVVAFPDYLWLTMAGALIAAIGLGVLLVKTVVTDLSWFKRTGDACSGFRSEWQRALCWWPWCRIRRLHCCCCCFQ